MSSTILHQIPPWSVVFGLQNEKIVKTDDLLRSIALDSVWYCLNESHRAWALNLKESLYFKIMQTCYDRLSDDVLELYYEQYITQNDKSRADPLLDNRLYNVGTRVHAQSRVKHVRHCYTAWRNGQSAPEYVYVS